MTRLRIAQLGDSVLQFIEWFLSQISMKSLAIRQIRQGVPSLVKRYSTWYVANTSLFCLFS